MSKAIDVAFEKQVRQLLDEIGYYISPRYVAPATAFALNETARQLNSRLAKRILEADELLKLKAVRRRIRLWRANANDLKAEVRCRFSNVRLTELGRPIQNMRMPGTLIRGRMYRRAFLAKMSDKVGRDVYIRKPDPKRPGKLVPRFPVKMVNIPIYDHAVKVAEDLCNGNGSSEMRETFGKKFMWKIGNMTGIIGNKDD